MYLEKCWKTGSNKLFKNLANSCFGDLIIDKIGLRGTSSLCNLGKPYNRGLTEPCRSNQIKVFS